MTTAFGERYVGFLRAINVGGRIVKMDALRRLFEQLGFDRVETFIASGNVVFESREIDAVGIENRVEGHLRKSLGFEVATFVRSTSELAAIDRHRPFEMAAGEALYVAFLRATPSAEVASRLVGLRTAFDEFHVHDREIYWLCRAKISDSRVSGTLLEKTAGMPATVRNSTTIAKLAAKYPAIP